MGRIPTGNSWFREDEDSPENHHHSKSAYEEGL